MMELGSPFQLATERKAVADRGGYTTGGMRLAPDGNRLAVIVGQPKSDIWIFDLADGSKTRLTFDPANHLQPSWLPMESALPLFR